MALVGNPIWPLADLRVVTPRLALCYIDDAIAVELANLAAHGIHDPAVQPFSEPWTDAPSPLLEQNTLRYFWRCRAETTPAHWDICLAVLVGGDPVGVCTLHADEFPVQRTITTGSWLGQRHQRKGIGTEMRHAALHLAFAGFGAQQALTHLWHDNAASLGVTRSLPYTQTTSARQLRRDRMDTTLEFTMNVEQWNTIRRRDIRLDGMAGVRAQLEIGDQR